MIAFSTNQMFSILKADGIPPNILGAIICTYNSLHAKAVSPDFDTDYFKIIAGRYSRNVSICDRKKEFELGLTPL